MRVHDVDAVVVNRPPQVPGSARVDLAEWTAIDHAQSSLDRARAQRLATPRGDDRPVSAAIQLAGEPERLALAAAPAALRVDVQHSQSHGAQLPRFDQRPQGRPRAMQAKA
jgi:hypothetical protein